MNLNNKDVNVMTTQVNPKLQQMMLGYPHEAYHLRILRAQFVLKANNVDGVVLHGQEAVSYFTGLKFLWMGKRPVMVVLWRDGSLDLVTPVMERENFFLHNPIYREAFEDERVHEYERSPSTRADSPWRKVLALCRDKNVAVDIDPVLLQTPHPFKQMPVLPLFAMLSMIKDQWEWAYCVKLGKACDVFMTKMEPQLYPGARVLHGFGIMNDMKGWLIQEGLMIPTMTEPLGGPAWPGRDSGIPHALTDVRAIVPNDFMISLVHFRAAAIVVELERTRLPRRKLTDQEQHQITTMMIVREQIKQMLVPGADINNIVVHLEMTLERRGFPKDLWQRHRPFHGMGHREPHTMPFGVIWEPEIPMGLFPFDADKLWTTEEPPSSDLLQNVDYRRQWWRYLLPGMVHSNEPGLYQLDHDTHQPIMGTRHSDTIGITANGHVQFTSFEDRPEALVLPEKTWGAAAKGWVIDKMSGF